MSEVDGEVKVRVDIDAGVATVQLDAPEKRNALGATLVGQLQSGLRRAADDPQVRAIVLTHSGGTFCAGADLKAVAAGTPNRVEPDGDAPMGISRMRLSKPVIAAIEGHAVAGGLELAIWADLRVAATDAVLGVFCRRWGVPLIDGGTVRLPRLIGASRAMDLILTGRPVDAAEAERIGLVNRTVEPGTALEAAVELGRQLAGFPQTCLRNDRLSMLEAETEPEAEALGIEYRYGLKSLLDGAVDGATRFSDGAGRHGAFHDE